MTDDEKFVVRGVPHDGPEAAIAIEIDGCFLEVTLDEEDTE